MCPRSAPAHMRLPREPVQPHMSPPPIPSHMLTPAPCSCPPSPGPGPSQDPTHHGADNGNPVEQVYEQCGMDSNDDNDSENEPENHDDFNFLQFPLPSITNEGSELPAAHLPQLQLSQSMIHAIRFGSLEDDIKDEILLEQVRNPSSGIETIDHLSRLSNDIFMAMSSCGSLQLYTDFKAALCRFDPEIELDSYFIVKNRVEQMSGVFKIMMDMCPNSCIAYAGPFSTMECCPQCQEPRYEGPSDPRKKNKPRKQFSTIPLGPQLQAQWKSPEGTQRMHY